MAIPRLLFLGFCVAIGFGAVHLINKAEIGKNLASAPTNSSKTQRVTLTAFFNPVKNTLRLKEVHGASMERLFSELFDAVGKGVPDRSAGYLYVMNAIKNRDLQDRQAYWKLTKGVAAIRLLSPSSHGATFSRVPNMPKSIQDQFEMWVTQDMDLVLEIDADVADGLIPANS